MSNGQMNSISVPAATQSPTLEAAVQVAFAMDSVLQNGGDFAGLLSGLQLQTAEKKQPDSGQVETLEGNLLLVPNAGAEDPGIDLLAQLTVSSRIHPASETDVQKPEDAEKAGLSADAVLSDSNLPDVSSQIILAAYAQPGRVTGVTMPAVPANEPVAPTAAEQNQHRQSETVHAAAVDRQPVTTVAAAPMPAPTVAIPTASTAVAAPTGAVQPLPSDRMSNLNEPSALPVDRQQNEATATEHLAVITAPSVKIQAEHASAAPAPASTKKPAAVPANEPVAPAAAEQNQHRQPETTRTTAVDRDPVTVVAAAPQTLTPAPIVAPAAPGAVQPVVSGRMPEVNKPSAAPVDFLQNPETATEQPAAIAAPAVKTDAEHASVVPLQASTEKPGTAPAEEPAAPIAAEPKQHQQPEAVETAAVDREPAATVATVVPPVRRVVQSVPSDLMSEVNKPAALPVDRQQNEATATEHSAVIAAPAVKMHPEHAAAEPMPDSSPEQSVPQAREPAARPAAEQHQHRQAEMIGSTVGNRQPVTVSVAGTAPHSEGARPVREVFAGELVASSPEPGRMPDVNKPSPLPVDRLQNGAAKTEQPAASRTPESEQPTAHRPAAAAGASAETEIEILLSQPQPITARVTAAAAAADNRSASMIQDIRAAWQQRHPESQTETVRAGNEQSLVKGLTSIQQAESSSGESMVESGASRGSDSNQGQTGGAPDNPVLELGIGGPNGAEQQKLSATAPRIISTEPAGQEIPEQIVHQVKERLVQHEVKTGNQVITLTLSPDSLGELKMNLNLQGQKLSVEIITENRTVRDAIVQHADALKESLARQNITMESFDVTTGGKGSGSQGQNPNAWRELAQQQQQQSWASPRVYHSAQADIPSGQGAYHRPQGHSMLDIHY